MLNNITMEKPPEHEDIPTSEELTQLLSYAGALNWLTTRTRPDLAYFMSLLASSSSKFGSWSRQLARKVLRYLAGTVDTGLTMAAAGCEDSLIVYSDAGFAGADTIDPERVSDRVGRVHYYVEIESSSLVSIVHCRGGVVRRSAGMADHGGHPVLAQHSSDFPRPRGDHD